MKEKCSVVMWNKFHRHACNNPAKVVIEGTYYCGVHDPERIKKREEKNKAAWLEKYKMRKAEMFGPEMLKILKEISELPEFERNEPYAQKVLEIIRRAEA